MPRYKRLLPPDKSARWRLLSLYVTPEKWEVVNRRARKLGTSKSEVLRFILNEGEASLKAQAIEARRAATVKQGAVHESAVAKPCAQTPPSKDPR